jgi:hypothetical protein
MLHLAYLESTNSIVTAEVQDVGLSSEILADIISRKKLVKSIDDQTYLQKCNDIPTEDELWNVKKYNDLGRTIMRTADGTFFLHNGNGKWILEGNEINGYKLSFASNTKIITGLPQITKISEYPLQDYEVVMRKKGCDIKRSMVTIIDSVSKRLSVLNIINIDEARAWIVQLSNDTNAGAEGSFDNSTELRDEVQRLLTAARQIYQ